MNHTKPKVPNLKTEFVKASKEDASLINKLAKEIWRKHYIPIIGRDTVEYMLKLMYAPDIIIKDMVGGLEYYLIMYSEEAIGYFGIKNESKRLFLSRIYIKEEYRGRKIGAKTIQFISSLGRNRSLPALYLSVAKSNSGSINFYKECGFEITDDIIKDIGDGHKMDDYIMTKELI